MNWYIPLLLTGGILLYKYLPTGLALLKMTYNLVSVGIESIEEKNITAYVILGFTNNSSKSILLQNLDLNIKINEKLVGIIQDDYSAPIPAHSAQNIKVLFSINQNIVGQEIWNIIINNKLYTSGFRLQGTVTANDVLFPINATWTIQDLTDL